MKTGEKITIFFLQYFITEICSFSENYPHVVLFIMFLFSFLVKFIVAYPA